MRDTEKARNERPYATNLLTLSKKTEEDIIEAKERVDANEK